MKTNQNQRNIITTLIFSAIALMNFSATAQATEDPLWKIKADRVIINGGDSFLSERSSGGSIEVGGEASPGVRIAGEYPWSSLFGQEVDDVFATTPDIENVNDGTDTEMGEGSGFTPFWLSTAY